MSIINPTSPTLSSSQRRIKRLFDLVVGSLSLVAALPLMAVIAMGVWLDSPGPIFFRQRRIGENGKPFGMYKFRSMVVGADMQLQEHIHRDAQGNLVYKLRDDPRVTRVGRILRPTSLDELPQLVNVLKGEMSLVGPRPELPILVAEYQTWQRARFSVPPGITGWWQVNGRSDRPMHLNTEDDLYYIQHYSLLLDVKILLMTVRAVVRRKGAF